MLASYRKSRPATFLLIIFFSISLDAMPKQVTQRPSRGSWILRAPSSNASVEVRNPVSGFSRNAVTDVAGKFTFPNVPFNPYHLMIGQGFAPYSQDVDVRSTVPVDLSIALKVAGSSESVTVEQMEGI